MLRGMSPVLADFVAEVGAETWITLTLHTANEAAALAHGRRGCRRNRTVRMPQRNAHETHADTRPGGARAVSLGW